MFLFRSPQFRSNNFRFIAKSSVENNHENVVNVENLIEAENLSTHVSMQNLAAEINVGKNFKIDLTTSPKLEDISDPLDLKSIIDSEKTKNAQELLQKKDANYKKKLTYNGDQDGFLKQENVPYVEIDYLLFGENINSLSFDEAFNKVDAFFKNFTNRLDAISGNPSFFDTAYTKKYFDLSYYLLEKVLSKKTSTGNKPSKYYQEKRSKLLSHIPIIQKSEKIYTYITTLKKDNNDISIKDKKIFSTLQTVKDNELQAKIHESLDDKNFDSNAWNNITVSQSNERKASIVQALKNNPDGHIRYLQSYANAIEPNQVKDLLIGKEDEKVFTNTEEFWDFHNHEGRIRPGYGTGANYEFIQNYFKDKSPETSDSDIKEIYASFLERSNTTLKKEFTGETTTKTKQALGPLYNEILPKYFGATEISQYIGTITKNEGDFWESIDKVQAEWLMQKADPLVLCQKITEKITQSPEKFIHAYNDNESLRNILKSGLANAKKSNDPKVNAAIFKILSEYPDTKRSFMNMDAAFVDFSSVLSAEQNAEIITPKLKEINIIEDINEKHYEWLINPQNIDPTKRSDAIIGSFSKKFENNVKLLNGLNEASPVKKLLIQSVRKISNETKVKLRERLKENSDFLLNEFNSSEGKITVTFKDLIPAIYKPSEVVSEILSIYNDDPKKYWEKINASQKDWLLNEENVNKEDLGMLILDQSLDQRLEFAKLYLEGDYFTKFVDELLGKLADNYQENKQVIDLLIQNLNNALKEAAINNKAYSQEVSNLYKYMRRNTSIRTGEDLANFAESWSSDRTVEERKHRYGGMMAHNKLHATDFDVPISNEQIKKYEGSGMHEFEWRMRIFDEIVSTDKCEKEEMISISKYVQYDPKTKKITKNTKSYKIPTYKINGKGVLLNTKQSIDNAVKASREVNGESMKYFHDRNVRVFSGLDDVTGKKKRDTVDNLFDEESTLEPELNKQGAKSLKFYSISSTAKAKLDSSAPAKIFQKYLEMVEDAEILKKRYLEIFTSTPQATLIVQGHGTVRGNIKLFNPPKDLRIIKLLKDKKNKIHEVTITPNDVFKAYLKRKDKFPNNYNDLIIIGVNCRKHYARIFRKIKQNNDDLDIKIKIIESKIDEIRDTVEKPAKKRLEKLQQEKQTLWDQKTLMPKHFIEAAEPYLNGYNLLDADGVKNTMLRHNFQLDPAYKDETGASPKSNLEEVINNSWHHPTAPGNPALYLPKADNPYDFIRVSDASDDAKKSSDMT